MAPTGNDTARVPLPDNIQCCVSVKVGRPLGKSRTTVGDPVVLTMSTTDTFTNVEAWVVYRVLQYPCIDHVRPPGLLRCAARGIDRARGGELCNKTRD